jgi:hypothetical protein
MVGVCIGSGEILFTCCLLRRPFWLSPRQVLVIPVAAPFVSRLGDFEHYDMNIIVERIRFRGRGTPLKPWSLGRCR